MSAKQRALGLIEASFQGYRSLLSDPPRGNDEFGRRKGEADAQQAQADIIMRGMYEDYRAVADAFAHANYEIEVIDRKVGQADSDAERYLEQTEGLDFRRLDEMEDEGPEVEGGVSEDPRP